jgi:hypothetical protein
MKLPSLLGLYPSDLRQSGKRRQQFLDHISPSAAAPGRKVRKEPLDVGDAHKRATTELDDWNLLTQKLIEFASTDA